MTRVGGPDPWEKYGNGTAGALEYLAGAKANGVAASR